MSQTSDGWNTTNEEKRQESVELIEETAHTTVRKVGRRQE